MNKIRRAYYATRKWILIAGAVFLCPVFLILINRRARFHGNGKLRILVIPNVTRIGDLVCATPVFKMIKEKYPDCYLAVLTQKKNAGIIKNNPRIDEIIDFKSSDLVKRVLGEVRKKRFHWSINLVGTPQGSLVSFFGLVPNRVVLTRAGKPLTEIFTDRLNNYKFFYKNHTHLPSFYTQLLKPLGIKPAAERKEVKEVFTTFETERKIEQWLASRKLENVTRKLVGISITAGNKIKEWGDDKFKSVARYVVEQKGCAVIVLGGKNDETRIDAFLEGLDKRRYFKSVDFSIEELPSFMKRLHLYIAVDTGPIYIAHALKVPLIDIVGPCDPREQPPKDETSFQVLPEGNVAPSSFVLKRPGKPEEHKTALRSTRVEAVLAAIDKMLQSNARRVD